MTGFIQVQSPNMQRGNSPDWMGQVTADWFRLIKIWWHQQSPAPHVLQQYYQYTSAVVQLYCTVIFRLFQDQRFSFFYAFVTVQYSPAYILDLSKTVLKPGSRTTSSDPKQTQGLIEPWSKLTPDWQWTQIPDYQHHCSRNLKSEVRSVNQPAAVVHLFLQNVA